VLTPLEKKIDQGDDSIIFDEVDTNEFPSSITNSPPKRALRTWKITQKLKADIELLDGELYPRIKKRAKLLCRTARQATQLADQLQSDNSLLLRRHKASNARITKRQINIGGPIDAGDSNRMIRAREATEMAAENKRRKKRGLLAINENGSPTLSPCANGVICHPEAGLL
jgi:hypothetical protein